MNTSFVFKLAVVSVFRLNKNTDGYVSRINMFVNNA